MYLPPDCRYLQIFTLKLPRADGIGSHVYFNLPPAVLLTLLYHPLFTLLDAYKVSFLVIVSRRQELSWDWQLKHS